MSFLVPPVTALPPSQPTSAAQGLGQQNQAPTAIQAAAAVTAVPVGGQQTRMAATASGNSGGSGSTKSEKGKKSDSQAAATETRTNTRLRDMGKKADLSV
ncbi:MAG: hypothetical protein VW600_11760 [Ferrovibrio sp.]